MKESEKFISLKNKCHDEAFTLSKFMQHVARRCRYVVKHTAIRLGNKQYISLEGWQAIAKTHNYTISTDQTQTIYDPDHSLRGYVSTATLRNHQGTTLATAQGFIGVDELKLKNVKETFIWYQVQCRAIHHLGVLFFGPLVPYIGRSLSTGFFVPEKNTMFFDHTSNSVSLRDMPSFSPSTSSSKVKVPSHFTSCPPFVKKASRRRHLTAAMKRRLSFVLSWTFMKKESS